MICFRGALPRVVVYAQCLALSYLVGLVRFEGLLTANHKLYPAVYSLAYTFGTALILALVIWPVLLTAALVVSWNDEKHPLIPIAACALLEFVYLIAVAMISH